MVDADGPGHLYIPESEAGPLPPLPADRLLEKMLWVQHCLLLQRGLPEGRLAPASLRSEQEHCHKGMRLLKR